MEKFTGLCRDYRRTKLPPNTWEFARNILLKKGFDSPCNEEGFDYKHDIPGKIIGIIDTNEELVYFSIDGIYSCIGIYKTNENSGYIPKIRSIYLGFKENRPIEGVFFYNFKKELIIGFCDGIFEDSNTPKLINLNNTGISLTPLLELQNPEDIGQLNLFPNSIEGEINIDYENTGSLDIEVAYITFAYVLADGQSITSYFPIHNIAYTTYNFRELDKRNLIINFTNLDLKYTKLKIGIVVIKEEGLFGYESNIKTYTNNSLTYILSSLSDFSETNVDNLIIPSDVYSRVETMTMNHDEFIIGNLVKTGSIKLQKFACNLKLKLYYDIREENKHTHPILCPDEVYSFYISGHLLDGTYTEEFHIPGEKDISGLETQILSNTDINNMGLNYLNTIDTYKRFRIINSGGFKISTVPVNINNINELELKWGYWENQETYPNNEEYNGSLDYNNNNIINGEDLRETNIRYHRIPGLDNLVEKFPCLLGYNNKNTNAQLTGAGRFHGLVPSFAVEVDNFEEAIPLEYRNLLQGYRLSIVKRKTGERLIEDINFLKQCSEVEMETSGGNITFNTTLYHRPDTDGNKHRFAASQFGFSRVRSNTLSLYKPNLNNSLLIKANYGLYEELNNIAVNTTTGLNELILNNDNSIGNVGGINWINGNQYDIPKFNKINNTQKYAVLKELKYLEGNNINNKTFLSEECILLKAENTLQPTNSSGSLPQIETRWNPLLINDNLSNPVELTLKGYNSASGLYEDYIVNNGSSGANDRAYYIGICSTFINLPKNVYSGFKPIEFITIGKCKTDNNNSNSFKKLFKLAGDIFVNNLYNIEVGQAYGSSLQGRMLYNQLAIKGLISIPNNSEIYTTKNKKYGVVYQISDAGSEIDSLISLDYQLKTFNKETLRSLNDLIIGVAFSINNPFIDYFPYRIHRSLKIGNESIETNNIRRFLSNRYKEMLNDRGEIIALRGTNKILYIQQKYSLFVASIKDTLETNNGSTYIGTGDIFDRIPEEIMYNSNKGFIGCVSKFASKIIKDGYLVIDSIKGNIYLINDKTEELSNYFMDNYFNNNLNLEPYYVLDRFGNKKQVDNPFTQVGHLIGYDKEYNRLLITKKLYKFKYLNLIGTTYTFNGEYYYLNEEKLDFNNSEYFEEISKTFSFNLDNKDRGWICEHDYYPNVYGYTNNGLYPIKNLNNKAEVYRSNSKLNKGLYFGIKYESYLDCVFNNRLDLSKLYQNISWNSQVITDNNETLYYKTFDYIILYNDIQCTGKIDLNPNIISLERNIEGIWQFNNFRDIVIDKNLPIVNIEGELNINNLNINKSYFEKSNFLSTFIVVRVGINNDNNNTIYLHYINVKSRISDRV